MKKKNLVAIVTLFLLLYQMPKALAGQVKGKTEVGITFVDGTEPTTEPSDSSTVDSGSGLDSSQSTSPSIPGGGGGKKPIFPLPQTGEIPPNGLMMLLGGGVISIGSYLFYKKR